MQGAGVADAQEVEAEGLRRLRQLAPAYRARPSLASPLLGAAGRSLGALAGVLPRRYGDALMGACVPGRVTVGSEEFRWAFLGCDGVYGRCM